MEENGKKGLKILLLILFIGLIALSLSWRYLPLRKGEKLSWEKSLELGVKMRSIEGQVVSLAPDRLVVKTGRVERREGASEFEVFEQDLFLSPKILFVEGDKKFEVASSKLGSYLKVKDRAVFYTRTPSFPEKGNPIPLVERVELLSRGNLESGI